MYIGETGNDVTGQMVISWTRLQSSEEPSNIALRSCNFAIHFHPGHKVMRADNIMLHRGV